MQFFKRIPLPIPPLACALMLLAALGGLPACGSTPQGPPRAEDELTRDVYQRDCARGIGSACYELGESYVDGRWGPTDDTCGFALLEQACLGHYVGACARVGEMEAEGRGTAKDVTTAAAVLQRACEDGSARACGYLDGLGRIVGARTMNHAPTARARTASAVD